MTDVNQPCFSAHFRQWYARTKIIFPSKIQRLFHLKGGKKQCYWRQHAQKKTYLKFTQEVCLEIWSIKIIQLLSNPYPVHEHEKPRKKSKTRAEDGLDITIRTTIGMRCKLGIAWLRLKHYKFVSQWAALHCLVGGKKSNWKRYHSQLSTVN